MDQFALGEIPDELLRRITSRLHTHSTALLRLKGRTGPERPLYIGSGTFVSIGDIHGILTARHVADKLAGPFHLGLAMAREGEEHRFAVNMNSLSIIRIPEGETEEFGPDISFIALSDWDGVATIRASRSFHQLLIDRDELVQNPPDVDIGIWFVCGSPEEMVTEGTSETGFGGAISLTNYCYAGGVDPGYEKGDFDYFDVPFKGGDSTALLRSYEGVSGGGLWQGTVRRSDEGGFTAGRFLYSGLAFLQGFRSYW